MAGGGLDDRGSIPGITSHSPDRSEAQQSSYSLFTGGKPAGACS